MSSFMWSTYLLTSWFRKSFAVDYSKKKKIQLILSYLNSFISVILAAHIMTGEQVSGFHFIKPLYSKSQQLVPADDFSISAQSGCFPSSWQGPGVTEKVKTAGVKCSVQGLPQHGDCS